MKKKEHILLFPAHPDDEGAAWATILKYHESGAKISIAWMTYGDRAIAPIGKYVNFLVPIVKSFLSKQEREKLSKYVTIIRKKEALQAAKLINASPFFLGFKDTQVPTVTNKSAVLKIIDLIRKLKPTIILTHWFNEIHTDHKNTAKLIYTAYKYSADPKYKTNFPPHIVRIMGFWDERGGRDYHPNYFINVQNQINQIKKWGKIYKSQAFRIVGRFPNIKARNRGKNTPFHYAEAFKIIGIKRKQTYGEFFPN